MSRQSCKSFGENGSLTVFTVIMSIAFLAAMGLVVDTGRALAARSAALDEAELAARVGTDQLSADELRQGQVEIDPSSAIQSADSYLRSIFQTGSTSVSGQTVTVSIDEQTPTVMLGIIGINRIDVDVSASATNVHGVTEEDP
jgi:Flp pilus assembly protein TadG